MKIRYLDAAIQAVCPIHGVDSNGIISFKGEATVEQRAAAQALVDLWDFNNPSAAELADDAAEVDLKDSHAAAGADRVVQYLRNHTPAECAAYVNTNVTSLATAKTMLEKFAMILCVITKKEFPR